MEYKQLLDYGQCQNSYVGESAAPYQFITERHLQAMWLDQKYFENLKTEEGAAIEILSPGIWNGEAGPDFLKAHIRINGLELRGDIELHLSEESWYQHKHDEDNRYNDVILHISYWKPRQTQSVKTRQGHFIPRTHLESFLTIPEARIVQLIDLDLYPYKHFVGSGRCARMLFNKLSDDSVKKLLCSAANWRLKQKRDYLLAKVKDPSDAFCAGIAIALGYKHNTEPFFDLFYQMKALKHASEQTLYAFALSQSSFFSQAYQKKWSGSLYYQSLLSHVKDKSLSFTKVNFTIDKVRPANHPIRRLAILAKLMKDESLIKTPDRIVHLWNSYWHEKKWKKLLKAFIDLVPSYEDQYWERHYSFEASPQKRPIALLGKDLKREILLNVFLPFLYEAINERPCIDELEAFNNFYSNITASETRKTAYLNQRFFGHTHRQSLLSQANTQQGAYQIHRDFCIHYEASCVGCPFVERYTAAFASPRSGLDCDESSLC